MEESTTYQEIIEKGVEKGLERGRLAEARATVLRWGTKRLGDPTPQVVAGLDAITDVRRLEDLLDRLLDGAAGSWDDLLT